MRAPARSRALAIALLPVAAACGGEPEPAAVGTLERDRIELVAEAQEPVVEIAVREGQSVAEGQSLLRLDDARLAAELARARSARDRAAARLAEAERGPRHERITEARARLEGARSTLATARRDLERTRSLVEEGVAAPGRLDRDQAAYDEALARRDQYRAALAELLEGTTVEEIDQSRAALGEAEAAYETVRIQVERLHVRAPRPGVVDALPFEQGERPPRGAVVVVMLAEGAPYARVYVPEPVRVRVRPGTEARVRVDGVERSFAGRVRTVSSEASFTPYFALTERDRGRLSYLAEVDLTDPEAGELPTGVPVEVTFMTPQAAARPGP